MRSPIPLAQVLDYIRLEESDAAADALISGSVHYLGPFSEEARTSHYWSYPSGTEVAFVELGPGQSLSLATKVPPAVRSRASPVGSHRTRRYPAAPPLLPPNPGLGPVWVPSSKVRAVDVGYVARFVGNFDMIAKHFGARATAERSDGGAGATRYFLLQLSNHRMAMFSTQARHFGHVELHLTIREGGRVDWEDYEEVMAPLEIPIEEVFRQGGLVWRRRRKSFLPPGDRS